MVAAELSSPRDLHTFELVHNGTVVPLETQASTEGGIHRLRLRKRLTIRRSSWLAVRGFGRIKTALKDHTGIEQRTLAHTAAVRVIVGEEPIRSADTANSLIDRLLTQQEYYRTKAKYEKAEHRTRYLQLFDRAIAELQKQLK